MTILDRQYFATSQQFADAVVRQITQTPADNQFVSNALQRAITAVEASSPDAQIVYGTFSYRTTAGKWMRQIDLLVGLASPLSHFRYSMLFNTKNNLGDYYVDVSTMQMFDLTDIVSAVPFIGPLDTLQISPVAAWSLRRLTGQWSGAAIGVTRAADGVQHDIGFTVTGDLDLDALAAFAGSGDATIRTWYDQGGNGNHAVAKALDGAQPYIVQAGVPVTINGQAAIIWDSGGTVNQQLQAAVQVPMSNASRVTMNAVFNCAVQYGTGVADYFVSASYNVYRFGVGQVNSMSPPRHAMATMVTSSQQSSNTVSDTGFNAASAFQSGGFANIVLNGVQTAGTAALGTTANAQTLVLGLAPSSSKQRATVCLAEAIVLPSGDENALYADQRTYWSCP
ncbi:hypothetical protein HDG34_003105 [Paraburkholderia sp. HC6.4b]|uniref:arabinofuranosidase catalytic domain-containing protein n=1 Tax=unclassified Paraburkholderia TaxID=2615204 RepID=UPI00161E2644|nr:MULTISPECIES: arabinofuranosidase catalytic domain-containing protein [unclassified Paraburkholderia]MBB5409164.1 hypothetical protein [Paraburkholderia sp. HC6.4b]MBB5450892.1 hypothetical protein [Paraburkholderia sp. Kb1A]